MKNKNSIYYIIGFILLLGLAVILLKQANLFAITGADIPWTSQVIINQTNDFESFTNFQIVNNNINFQAFGASKVYSDGGIFYILDSNQAISNNFPDTEEGTHTINKYQVSIYLDNNTPKILIKKGEKTYDLIVKTVTVNVTVANQTFYVNVPGANQTVNNTVYINNTVEKKVMVEPTLDYLLQKYQMVIIGIIAVGLVYYLTRKKK
jgi:hypothetical protein